MKKRRSWFINCEICGKVAKTNSGKRKYCDEHAISILKKQRVEISRKYNLRKRVEKKKDLFCIYCGKSLIDELYCTVCCLSLECKKKYKSDEKKKWYSNEENKKKSIELSVKWNKENLEKHRLSARRYARRHRKELKEYSKKYQDKQMEGYKKIGEENKK